MRHIKVAKAYENKFSLLPFIQESDIATIKSFDTEYDFEPQGDERSLKDQFLLLYEIEYKYSMLNTRAFDGVEKRRENILKVLEEKAREIIPPLADTFQTVFHNWLAAHALTDAGDWADARMKDVVDMGDMGHGFDILMGELTRYSLEYKSFGDIFKEVVKTDHTIMGNYFDLWIQDMQQNMFSELEYDGIEDFNDSHEYLLHKKFEDKEEAYDFIDMNLAAFDEDFFKLFGSEEEAADYIVDEMTEAQMFDPEFIGGLEGYINMEQALYLAYKDIVFPVWFEHWESKGISKTRANVEKVYKQLGNIDRLPIEKQFMVINIAKNTSHQTGSMMDYYQEMWNIDEGDFESLSDYNVRDWDKELKQIGVRM